MRKIYVIGTLHNMMPKHKKELQEILEKMDPDQVLVEIVHSHLKSPKIRTYPREMQFAYRWAIKKKKETAGFDSPIDITKKDITKKEEAVWVKKWIAKFGHLTWKGHNKKKYDKITNESLEEIVDMKRHRSRQKEMLRNIRKRMISNGKILVLTGAGHLPFFEKNMKSAKFPLRK